MLAADIGYGEVGVKRYDVVVVGGGQAGLGIGYLLQEAGRSVVILERGRVGESWRSQRWDSFALNTPNWANGLPGYPYDDGPADGFGLRDDLVGDFERYVSRFGLPVREHTTVTSVEEAGDGGFLVELVTGSDTTETVAAANVVIASGSMQAPKVPPMRDRFPSSVTQLHAGEYRSPGGLPDGGVVVVGGGQSGCQIAEDLLHAGRDVYVCTSRVARLPRRYRGRDVLEWFDEMGLWDVTLGELPDPAMEFAAQPQVSGVGRHGSTLSLQHMASQGAHLMGRLADVVDGVMTTDDSLADHIAFADEFSAAGKADIDAHIAEHGLDAPPAEIDPIDVPAGPGVAEAGLTRLDLAAAGVSAVVWCTGFTASFDWIHLPVVDDSGRPLHHRGVSPVPGLYFLGFPWLHSRKSGVIHGILEDASHLEAQIAARFG
jgi:putative flavoprotein involved in K+ transport